MTAVEYLYEFLPTIIQKDLKNKFDKAKEMERQQIIDAATWGGGCATGEQYFKEKYKK